MDISAGDASIGLILSILCSSVQSEKPSTGGGGTLSHTSPQISIIDIP